MIFDCRAKTMANVGYKIKNSKSWWLEITKEYLIQPEFLFFFFNLFILIGGYLLYNTVMVLPYIDMNQPWESLNF